MDRDGLAALDWWYPSLDGRLVAYGLSRGGDELSTLHVRDVTLGDDLPDRIPYTQRASVAWTEGGFYYTAHPIPGAVPPDEESYHRRVRFHALGEDPRRDPLVFGEGRAKEDILQLRGSPDGRRVLITAAHGWTRNDVYILDRTDPSPIAIHEGIEAMSEGLFGRDRLWLRTNDGAPNFRIVAVDPRDPSPRRWETVIAEGEDPIESFAVTRDRIVVHTLHGAASRLAVWTSSGIFERELPLEAPGTVEGLHADARGDAVTYAFTTFLLPGAAVVADARDGSVREVARLELPARAAGSAAILVEQVSYPSRDGTPVTMFLVHRSDVPPQDVPTVLSGYGGFSVARTPAFNAGVTWWVEGGGLYALANLRGGSERGESWHRAGMLQNKQAVFDDFIAAAQALVAGGWTTPLRLGIEGGSNGGLLVGAALAQRPDLFAAVGCRVPLLDMLRYQGFRIARFWIPEYGSSDDPVAFRWLRRYSPYHNVAPGRGYPALLLTTAEGDSRVDPMHARKMAALLQSFQDDPPVLLRVDRDAGHGVGKPLHLQRDDLADLWSFFAWRLRGEDGMLGLR